MQAEVEEGRRIMSSYRRVPVLLVCLLVTAVPIAMAADPSASLGPLASLLPSASVEPSASTEASARVEPSASVEPFATVEPATPAAPTGTPAPRATSRATAEPEETNQPDKDKDKGPETPITVTGTVSESTNGKGWKTYSLTAGSKTYELSAGPPWFWGDKNPLAAYVGKSVTVVGKTHQGSTEIDVETVDGKAIREPGRPPWAGGPWVVGERHPGWKPWMAGGKPGNGHGRAGAPGQLKGDTGVSKDFSADEGHGT
jgi:hypothetical protein